MKRLIYSSMLAASLCACTKETINYRNPVPGENVTEVNATLSVESRNTLFTSEDGTNGNIAFKSLGGRVALDVNTNADWTYEVAGDSFVKGEADEDADLLTLSCGRNTVEKKLTATVTIKAGDKTATIEVSQNAYGTPEIVASKNNFHLAAKGEITASFEVTSTDPDWTFETSACGWMLVTKDGNTVRISAYRNEEYSDRSATFTIKAGTGEKLATETIDVLQDRAAHIESSASTVPVTPFSNEPKEVKVTANFDWEYSVSGNEDGWLTVEKTGNGFRFTPTANTDAVTRTVKVTIKAGDGKENIDTKEITVSQPGIDKDAFILGLHVKDTKTASMLPLEGVTDITVDWGDGTQAQKFTSDNPTHEYADTGYFVVSVKGQASTISAYSLYYEKDQIKRVYNWGRLGLTSMEYAFEGCYNLTDIPEDDTKAFAEVTSFANAFSSCEKLKTIPERLLAHAALAESADNIFSNCTSIKAIPRQIFSNCPALTDCSSAFAGMTGLVSVDRDLFANNPKITTLNSVFSGDAALTAIPSGIFRSQTECENFRRAFYETGLTEIPADLFKGCKSVDTFEGCFSGCAKLQSIPADLFNSGSQEVVKGGKKNKGMINVFNGCSSLKEIPAGLFDGFTRVKRLTGAFSGCTSLSKVSGNAFAGAVNVTDISGLFSGCASLTEIPVGVFDNLKALTDASYAFDGCASLTGESPYTEVNGVKYHLYERTAETAEITGFAEMEDIMAMFMGCTKLTDYDKMPDACKTDE